MKSLRVVPLALTAGLVAALTATPALAQRPTSSQPPPPMPGPTPQPQPLPPPPPPVPPRRGRRGPPPRTVPPRPDPFERLAPSGVLPSLARRPTPQELRMLANQLRSGVDPLRVQASILASDEYYARAGRFLPNF